MPPGGRIWCGMERLVGGRPSLAQRESQAPLARHAQPILSEQPKAKELS